MISNASSPLPLSGFLQMFAITAMNRDTLHVIATIQLYATIVGFQGEFLQHLKKYDICFSH
jgi:hypothetical protein